MYICFSKFIYNEYIRPYFFIARCSTISTNNPPELWLLERSLFQHSRWPMLKKFGNVKGLAVGWSMQPCLERHKVGVSYSVIFSY